MFITKADFDFAKCNAYHNGYMAGQRDMKIFLPYLKDPKTSETEDMPSKQHPDSFELHLEPYCDGCQNFEPDVEKPALFIVNRPIDGRTTIPSGPTIIRCANFKRCENIMNNMRRVTEHGNNCPE